jgi:hypothetical protein
MFPFCLVVVVDALRSGRALSKRAGTTPSDALHINVQINDNISPKIRPPKKIGPNDKIVRTVRMLALATVCAAQAQGGVIENGTTLGAMAIYAGLRGPVSNSRVGCNSSIRLQFAPKGMHGLGLDVQRRRCCASVRPDRRDAHHAIFNLQHAPCGAWRRSAKRKHHDRPTMTAAPIFNKYVRVV